MKQAVQHRVNIHLARPKTCSRTMASWPILWTAFALILLSVLCLLLNAADLVFIRKSLGKLGLGAPKDEGGRKKAWDTFAEANGRLEEVNTNTTNVLKTNKSTLLGRFNDSSWRQNGSMSSFPLKPATSENSSSAPIKTKFPEIEVRPNVSNIRHPATPTMPPSTINNTSTDNGRTKPIAVATNPTTTRPARSQPKTIPAISAKSISTENRRSAASDKTVRDPPSAATTTSISTSTCRRTCEHYNNKILLSPTDRAGLSDRFAVLSGTLQLAGYLCARVYLSRPRFWLAPKHNDGREVDVRVTWEDLNHFYFLDDDDDDQGNSSISSSSSSRRRRKSALVDWVNDANVNMPPLVHKIKRSRKYNKWLYVRTDNASHIGEHLERIESVSFSQNPTDPWRGFLWDIRAYYYLWFGVLVSHMHQRQHPMTMMPPSWSDSKNSNNKSSIRMSWRREMQPFGVQSANQGCQYARADTPAPVLQILQQMFDHIQYNVTTSSFLSSTTTHHLVTANKTWIGYFHLRRGDTVRVCNTTLERMERYINCSLTQPLKVASSNIKHHHLQVILLFSSDETSAEYRQQVARMVEASNHHQPDFDSTTSSRITVSFVDVDQLGQYFLVQAIQQGTIPEWLLGNNFYLYRIVSMIEWRRPEISFRLEQRRSTCPDCTNWTKHFLKQLMEWED